jgi:soluble lytic murein transglycosylase
MIDWPDVFVGRGIFSMRLLISWLLRMYQRIQTNINNPQLIWASTRIDIGWNSHLIFLNIKSLIVFISMAKLNYLSASELVNLSSVNQESYIDKKYAHFYQEYFKQKKLEDDEFLAKLKRNWHQEKFKEQKKFDYLGLINFEINNKNLSEDKLFNNSDKIFNIFSEDQKLIYLILKSEYYFSVRDYSKVVLILKPFVYEKENKFFEKIGPLYIKSLIELKLKFEACNFFSKYYENLQKIINWEEFNEISVKIAEFLVKNNMQLLAESYLKKPLLYFPLYESSIKAYALASEMECSQNKLYLYQNLNRLNYYISDEIIFNRISNNKYSREFILASHNIDENKQDFLIKVDELDLKIKEKMLEKLKILVAAREYLVAKRIVDYLYQSKKYSADFQRDEILFYRGRIYNSIYQPIIAAESYQEIFEKFPNSSFAKNAKIRYVLSLQYAKKYSKSISFIENNNVFKNKSEDYFFLFWHSYLNQDYKKSFNFISNIFDNNEDNQFYSKAFFWRNYLNFKNKYKNVFKMKNLSLLQSKNYPYSVFTRDIIIKDKIYNSNYSSLLPIVNENINDNVFFPNFKFFYDIQVFKVKNKKNKFYLLENLVKSKLYDFAKLEINYLLKQDLTKEERLKLSYLSYLAQDFLNTNKLSLALDKFDDSNLDFINLPDQRKMMYYLNYPLAYWNSIERSARILNMNPFWLLSVMRSESVYNPNAESSVGAIGLMQIMPYTGVNILNIFLKHKGNIKNFNLAMLRNPDEAIAFAAFYLKILLDNYKGNYVLATAAYNAGPSAVNRWIVQNPQLDTTEFYENIPFNETKKYIANVFGSMDIYSRIYLHHPLKLNFDITQSLGSLKPNDLF